MTALVDYGDLEFTRPADKIKAVNVPDVPQEISTGMKVYEDAARNFNLYGFERTVRTVKGEMPGGIFLSHRPEDAQVSQVYRISTDPANTALERLTHFNIGTGRIIATFKSIAGEDWRGVYRLGGAIMSMDFNGNEHFQLWRYWEDALCEQVLPKIDGELDNAPGNGRIERLTHDDYRYDSIIISPSNKLMAFVSNKENNTDTLAYITRLIGSSTGATSDSTPLCIPSQLVTPPLRDGKTERWVTRSFSVDDKYLLLTRAYGNVYQPTFVVDISGSEPGKLERIILPGATEREEATTMHGSFSLDPANAHVIYFITNAYGDFDAVVSYDMDQRTVTHITTPNLDASVPVLKPVSWEVEHLGVTDACIYFTANVEGWNTLYAMPLRGPNKNTVIEVKLGWEGGWIAYSHNGQNGRPYELVLRLASYRSRGFVRKATLDLQTIKHTPDGNAYIDVELTPYVQAAAPEIAKAVAPKLIKFRSFDGLEVPALYYHPNKGNSKAPVVIGIHGGPESQATVQYRTATHDYLLNELGIAVIYPNVRGSSGYGRKYMSLDDVWKREDAVKDINALIEYIGSGLSGELDPSRIAVMDGGYMVFATLTHYSSKLKCGVANFGIGNWATFLENTAPVRRANRRLEYGDESDPVVRAFLERISPLNNADKIRVPLFITHGESDTRVTVHEAVAMYKIARDTPGGQAQLVICEGEGHGYRQKSVIEYVNAATIDYLKRFLLS
ncbi:alpha beta-hydrolase [Boletus edulis BED1]|uniref:Dipeptidyl-peptidase V n=1 Tax=Boletus edulis BED1 TaxID=1328754 RepID=A0AAD4C943_BOLED|nr:alpha beta-hydrolase [Boletus edulis BED1]